MKERLIELLDKKQVCGWKYVVDDYTTDIFNEEIADYLLANGVIVPPCKVGDTVYVLDRFDYDTCKEGSKRCPHLYCEYGVGYECDKTRYGEKPLACTKIKIFVIKNVTEIFNYWNEFGKTVFLTREEAEKALKIKQQLKKG